MNKSLFNIYSISLIVLSVMVHLLNMDGMAPIVLFLALLQLYLFFVVGKNIEQDVYTFWISPLYTCLLGLFVVNYQTFINVQLGFGVLDDYFRFAGGFSKYYLACLCLSTSSMSFFLIGAVNYSNKRAGDFVTVSVSPLLINILLVLSALYFLSTINVSDFISGAVYKGTGAYDRGVADYGYSERFLDSMIFISLAIYVNNYNCHGLEKNSRGWFRSIPICFWIVVIFYLTLRLFSGDRGPVIYTGFAILYAYIYCTHNKMKFLQVVGVFVLGAMLATTISYARMMSDTTSFQERLTMASEVASANSMKNISPYTQELASSNQIIYIMMEQIDEGKVDFKYGTNILVSMVRSIPGMGWFMNNVLVNTKFQTQSSGEYVTVAMLGKQYEYGLGSSVLADFYYDFGWIGCWLGFLFSGIIFKHITYTLTNSRQGSIISLILTLKVASLSLYISRSTLWQCLGGALFIIIIFGCINVFLVKSQANYSNG